MLRGGDITVGGVTILVGDVLQRLADIPDESVDCVFTSPPYWGLRDYGVEGQLGLEPTLGQHLEAMVAVFDAVRRVMKPEASLWINYGDCYATQPNGRSAAATKAAGKDDRTFRDKPFSTVGPVYVPEHEPGDRRGKASNKQHTHAGSATHTGRVVAGGYLKPKDLCMVPNRLAIALQEAGWWVRSEIIWGKPNGMPDSSGRYRPGTSHEKIWLLSKTAKMFYDAEAVRVPALTPGQHRNVLDPVPSHQPGRSAHTGLRKSDKQRGHSRRHAGFNDRWGHMTKAEQQANGRLLRNYEPPGFLVWHVPTTGYSEAHFATFPPELPARGILAGCPQGGTVLDIFGGAGTTGLVAARLDRRAILIELSPDYAAMAADRIRAELSPLEAFALNSEREIETPRATVEMFAHG